MLADKPPLDEALLEHHGVRGMHWGRRKGKSESTPKLSRKQYKAKVKQEKSTFYQKKANSLLDEATKNPEVLIKLKTHEPYPRVVTGKEFVDHMTKGGLMDVKMTDIYARKAPDGVYDLNPEGNRVYKKPKR